MNHSPFVQGELDAERRKLSGWPYTDTVTTTACPRCGVPAGEQCQTPKGRKAWPPHGERGAAYQEAIGPTEFDRRHKRAPIQRLNFVDILSGGRY
jgi:hypothetical protein